MTEVTLRLRPLPVRLWLGYKQWRTYFGVWDSIRATFWMAWAYKRGQSIYFRYRDDP